MSRNAEPTKRKLLDAARDEFAARGLAGARVDAIAKAAGCNKQLIYQHFGSKSDLFDSVFDQMVAGFLDNVPMVAGNLADYAGRLFDYYDENPKLLQLATWYRLERELPDGLSEAALRAGEAKVKAIEHAQSLGQLNRRYAAPEILSIVVSLSQIGSPTSSEGLASVMDKVATRAMILKAVTELTAPDIDGN